MCLNSSLKPIFSAGALEEKLLGATEFAQFSLPILCWATALKCTRLRDSACSPPHIGQMQRADEKSVENMRAGNRRKHGMLAEVWGGLTSRLLGGWAQWERQHRLRVGWEPAAEPRVGRKTLLARGIVRIYTRMRRSLFLLCTFTHVWFSAWLACFHIAAQTFCLVPGS